MIRLANRVAALILLLLAGELRLAAQDPFADPFGGAATPATPTEPAAAVPAEPEETETNPVVLSLRSADPQMAEDLTRAVEILVNIERPDEALVYLQKLLDADLDQTARAALHRKFGSTLFLRLMRHGPVQPAGSQFGRAVLDAAYHHARDPQRLQALIAKLSDPSPEVRYLAGVDLRAGGQAAVVVLISALADSSRSAEHARIRDGLVQIGAISVPPLVAALGAQDDSLRAQVLVVLGRLEAKEATPYLLEPYLAPTDDETLQGAARFALLKIVGQLPTAHDAKSYLARRARAYLSGEPVGKADDDGLISVWRWDASSGTVAARLMKASSAGSFAAARIAGDLHSIVPDDEQYRRLYLAARLESAKREVGLDQPLASADADAHAEAAAAGVELLEEVLHEAMQQEHVAAAIGAAEVLGDIGDRQLLHDSSGHLRPLVQALRHADRRLRFAAAMSLMKLDPQAPFPGSSYLPETLAYFLHTLGTRRALIAHPRLDQAQTLVGLLSELGFEADMAQTGRQAVRLAASSPDYEFVLVSDALDDPAVSEVIQQLRRAPRTANLPIGLMARQQNFAAMERLTEEDPLAETFPRPHELSGVALVSRRLLERGESRLVDTEQRVRQAEQALDQVARLAEDPQRYAFYDLFRQQPILERALFDSRLSAKAARVLGHLGTPSAQRALVTVASQNARPLLERQSAAAAFETAVQRRGLLLLRSEILLQYDRYNLSATADRETQQVLGSILDAIEAPSRSAREAGSGGQEEGA